MFKFCSKLKLVGFPALTFVQFLPDWGLFFRVLGHFVIFFGEILIWNSRQIPQILPAASGTCHFVRKNYLHSLLGRWRLCRFLLTLSPVQVFWAIKLSGGGSNRPPLFLGNYNSADHPEIRYAYGSDHSDGLPIGSGTKYPEFPEKFRNYHFSGIFRKVRNFLNFRKFID